MKANHSIPEQDTVAQRWKNALLMHEPNLPHPVIDAMVENVAQSPIGETLRQVEEGMFHLETLSIENLTGSEAKTILAILAQMSSQVRVVETKIQQLWELRS